MFGSKKIILVFIAIYLLFVILIGFEFGFEPTRIFLILGLPLLCVLSFFGVVFLGGVCFER